MMLQFGLIVTVVSLAVACVVMYADAQHWAVYVHYFERYGDFILIGSVFGIVIGLLLVAVAIFLRM